MARAADEATDGAEFNGGGIRDSEPRGDSGVKGRRSGVGNGDVGGGGVAGRDILFIILFFEREVGGGRGLADVLGDWAGDSELVAGDVGVVSKQPNWSGGDDTAEKEKDGVWAVFNGGVCDSLDDERSDFRVYLGSF